MLISNIIPVLFPLVRIDFKKNDNTLSCYHFFGVSKSQINFCYYLNEVVSHVLDMPEEKLLDFEYIRNTVIHCTKITHGSFQAGLTYHKFCTNVKYNKAIKELVKNDGTLFAIASIFNLCAPNIKFELINNRAKLGINWVITVPPTNQEDMKVDLIVKDYSEEEKDYTFKNYTIPEMLELLNSVLVFKTLSSF